MSGTAELPGLYTALEESARLLDVTCSRDRVWPILTAYGDVLPRAVIAFRVATGSRHEGELDCRFLSLPGDVDPYAVAVSNGLTAETDHPAGALLSDIQQRCPIDSYGIDFGVVGGFKKTWSFFPGDDFQELPKLADIASMPRGLAENAGFFARYGLDDRVSLVGIDYPHRTVNVYFGELPPECLEPEAIRSMHRDLDLPEPSEQMLRLSQESFGLYVTLSWDSPKIKRISFGVMTPDPQTLPGRLDPKIEHFVKNDPYGAAAPKVVYVAMSSTEGEYYKLQSYYRWRPRMLDLMQVSDDTEDPA